MIAYGKAGPVCLVCGDNYNSHAAGGTCNKPRLHDAQQDELRAMLSATPKRDS